MPDGARLIVPAGALPGFIGVSLWVRFYVGAGVPYPNVAQAQLMIEGLMASFLHRKKRPSFRNRRVEGFRGSP